MCGRLYPCVPATTNSRENRSITSMCPLTRERGTPPVRGHRSRRHLGGGKWRCSLLLLKTKGNKGICRKWDTISPRAFLNQKCACVQQPSFLLCVCVCVWSTCVLIYLLIIKFILEWENCLELKESTEISKLQCMNQLLPVTAFSQFMS